jgi:hypothetical protein
MRCFIKLYATENAHTDGCELMSSDKNIGGETEVLEERRTLDLF